MTTLEHLINSIQKSRLDRVAVITFDDGFKDLYQNAYPILKRLNIPFTLFLTSSTVDSQRLLWFHKLFIAIDKLSPRNRLNLLRKYVNIPDGDEDLNNIVGKILVSCDKNVVEKLASNMADEANLSEEEEGVIAKKLYLTKAELLEMGKNGLSIDAHGHEHLRLANLTQAETEKEIITSVQYIIQELYRKPNFYCLSFGIGNRFVADIVKALELSGVATIEPRLVRKSEDLYGLPRVLLPNDFDWFYRLLTR